MCLQLWSRRPCVLVLALVFAGPWPGSASAGYVGWDQAGPTSDVRMNADAELTKAYGINSLWMDVGAERLYGSGSLNLLGGKLISSGELQEISLPFLNTSPRGDLDLQVTTSGELILRGTIGARDVIKDGAGRLTLGILPTSPLRNVYIKEGVLSVMTPAALDAADRVIFSGGTTFAPAAGANRPFEIDGGQVNIIGPVTDTASVAASGTGGLTILGGKVGLSGSFIGDTIIRGGEVSVIRPAFQGKFIVEGGWLAGSVLDQPVVVPGAARLTGSYRSPVQFGTESAPAVVTVAGNAVVPDELRLEGPVTGRLLKMGDGALRLNSSAAAADIELTDGKLVLEQSMQGTLTASIGDNPILPLPNPLLQTSVETGSQPVSVGSLVLRSDLGIGGKSDLAINGPTDLQAGNRLISVDAPRLRFGGPISHGTLSFLGQRTVEFLAAGDYTDAQISLSGQIGLRAPGPIKARSFAIGQNPVLASNRILPQDYDQWLDCPVLLQAPLIVGDINNSVPVKDLRISTLVLRTNGYVSTYSDLQVDRLESPTDPMSRTHLIKQGRGRLVLGSGDAGDTIEVTDGALEVNGHVTHRNPIQLHIVNTGHIPTLAGHGTVGAVTGNGGISPGIYGVERSAAILTIDSIPSAEDMKYLFDFTALSPHYVDRENSLNDVLVMESSAPMTFNSEDQNSKAKVYFDLPLHEGDIIKGGFYAKRLRGADLARLLRRVDFDVWAKNFDTNRFERLDPSRYILGAVDEPVSSIEPFFSWNGSVATFTIVPEPGFGVLIVAALSVLSRRRRNG